MDIKGFFKAGREKYYLGEPIGVTLFIKNETDNDVYLFVPQGRDNGLRITVKEGKNFQISSLRDEPEVGLVPKVKLPVGGVYTQQYPLTQWLRFKEPDHYVVECALEVESYNVSLQQKKENRVVTLITISTNLHFSILSQTGRNNVRSCNKIS